MLAVLFAGLLLAQDPDVDALLKLLEDDSIEVRDKAASKLIELGDAAEPKINARLASADGEFKARLNGVLRDIGKARKLNSIFPKTRRVSLDVKDAPLR
ncbi:MAG TPA: hypothetical protein VFS19_06555, partial [Planctomycetota bacterium]|nr:hypothetical protein [Planctomycetota bacterium]